MTTPPRLATYAAALALTAALSGCSLWGLEGGPDAQGAALPSLAAQPEGVVATTGADGVQRIEITVDDKLRMTPDVVTAHPGRIELTFRNIGLTPHDIALRLPTATATGNLNGADTRTLTIDVTEPGTYPLPCLYHGTSGMRATLHIR
ncbi:cupredoxin domain-containing protein [Catellatospora sp. NPDC049609]|uniref:cupredoxin domain-containing protein n=1 Tax=Catellatospora sp. NPDC049609 TaxID=3155505 RepID=UPI003443181E